MWSCPGAPHELNYAFISQTWFCRSRAQPSRFGEEYKPDTEPNREQETE